MQRSVSMIWLCVVHNSFDIFTIKENECCMSTCDTYYFWTVATSRPASYLAATQKMFLEWLSLYESCPIVFP